MAVATSATLSRALILLLLPLHLFNREIDARLRFNRLGCGAAYAREDGFRYGEAEHPGDPSDMIQAAPSPILHFVLFEQ